MKIFLALPVAAAALYTLSFFDIPVSSFFYQDGAWSRNSFVQWLYLYGPWPSILLSAGAVLWLVLSHLLPALNAPKALLLSVALTMSLGSGLLVHYVFKEHWGRARPVQVYEFGGTESFTPFYTPSFTYAKKSVRRSFPCGHASCGFVFFAVAETYRQQQKRSKALIWYAVALFSGFLLGYARVAVGGHFFSDVVLCGLIMYGTACASAAFAINLYRFLPKNA